jgi:Fur family transcriptional regulator, zinc uptake regulator
MPYPPAPASNDEQAFLEHAASRCRARGASLTPIRRKVLALLRVQPGGLKAYDLLERIKLNHPSASPPTVYRALDFLIEQGLVHKIGRINQFVACNQHCHDDASLFLVCPGCGTVTELHDEVALVALSKSLEAAGHTLTGPEIELSAICHSCIATNDEVTGPGPHSRP